MLSFMLDQITVETFLLFLAPCVLLPKVAFSVDCTAAYGDTSLCLTAKVIISCQVSASAHRSLK